MEIDMQKAQAALRDIGFQKVYSGNFMYRRQNKGTEAIYCFPFIGAVLYILSIGGIVRKARMALEVANGQNLTKAGFIECKYYEDYEDVHLMYDLMPILAKTSQREKQNFFNELVKELKLHKQWDILPSGAFLGFINEGWEDPDSIWQKLTRAESTIRQIWRIQQ